MNPPNPLNLKNYLSRSFGSHAGGRVSAGKIEPFGWGWLPHLKVRNFIIVLLLSLIFIALIKPARAQEEKMLWNAEECQKSCDSIKQQTTTKIEEKIAELQKDSTKNATAIQSAKEAKSQVQSWVCAKNSQEGLTECYAPPLVVELNVPIGNTTVARGLVHYIVTFFNWGVRAIAVLAVIMLMIAGITWLSAGGNSQLIEDSKTKIRNSIAGLLLALGSVFLLNMINPRLTDLSELQIQMVPTIAQGIMWCRNLPVGTVLTVLEGQESAGSTGEIITNWHGSCGYKYKYGPGDLQQNTCWGDSLCETLEEELGENLICAAKIGKVGNSIALKTECSQPEEWCEDQREETSCNNLSIPKEYGYCRWQKPKIGRGHCVYFPKALLIDVVCNMKRPFGDKIIQKCGDYLEYRFSDIALCSEANCPKIFCENDFCEVNSPSSCSYIEKGGNWLTGKDMACESK